MTISEQVFESMQGLADWERDDFVKAAVMVWNRWPVYGPPSFGGRSTGVVPFISEEVDGLRADEIKCLEDKVYNLEDDVDRLEEDVRLGGEKLRKIRDLLSQLVDQQDSGDVYEDVVAMIDLVAKGAGRGV